MQDDRKWDAENCNWGVLLAWSSRFTADWLEIGFVILVCCTGCGLVALLASFDLVWSHGHTAPECTIPTPHTTDQPTNQLGPGPGGAEGMPGI